MYSSFIRVAIILLLTSITCLSQGNYINSSGKIGEGTGTSSTDPKRAIHIHSSANDNANDPTLLLSTGDLPTGNSDLPIVYAYFSLLNGINNYNIGNTNDALLQSSRFAHDLILASRNISNSSIRLFTGDLERVRVTDYRDWYGLHTGVGIGQSFPLSTLHLDEYMLLNNNSMTINRYVKTFPNVPQTNPPTFYSSEVAFEADVPSVRFSTSNYFNNYADNNRVFIQVDRAGNTDDHNPTPPLLYWSKPGYTYKGLTINVDNGYVGINRFGENVGLGALGAMLDIQAEKRGADNLLRVCALRIVNSDEHEQFKVSDDGYVLCRELKVAVPGSPDWNWPDYVFNADYNLVSIDSLARYVNERKHLPGIPSVNEVTQNKGVEIGDMQRKMLQKIEELTLYVIALHKNNEVLKLQYERIQSNLSGENK